ncbi:hypothetical protein Patl1_23416 [Pistacia atlantica]|uniref:Uncharacterized protein n=1 Tax=Pistacia atlantica TaxID=434234 RepID=A0ACC0ZZH6_9ROSI|nr:hypothetical protein Patl1_23416 [Pistacia atlantica]
MSLSLSLSHSHSQSQSNLPSFATPQSLSNWLNPHLSSNSFTSHNLWLELSEGETCLVDSNPPIRIVNVVTISILEKNNQILVESRQELSNEKMKANETHEEVIVHAVKEELGFDGNTVRIVLMSYNKKVEEGSSKLPSIAHNSQ